MCEGDEGAPTSVRGSPAHPHLLVVPGISGDVSEAAQAAAGQAAADAIKRMQRVERRRELEARKAAEVEARAEELAKEAARQAEYAAPQDEHQVVVIIYRNHRGNVQARVIRPRRFYFAANQWHFPAQWLCEAHDVDRGETRTFAMRDVLAWGVTGR